MKSNPNVETSGVVQPELNTIFPPPLSEKLTDTAPGTNIPQQLGPYRIEHKLGQGGMGAVYKATHLKLEKVVALKILAQQFSANKDFIARFEREMKAVGRLDHPNIVRAMDAGEVQGIHFLAMEYVAGIDLAQLVNTRGPMTPTNACRAIQQVALALDAAHRANLIHRDIKPSNLLMSTNTRQIKVLDLGLALLEDSHAGTALTATGQTFGTPDYMAPEQWENPHTVDPRVDLYALGCTLHFLLTGKAPYSGNQYKSIITKMRGHIEGTIPNLQNLVPNLRDDINSIYTQLLAKNPDDRFASAAALLKALELVIPGKFQNSIAPTSAIKRAKYASAESIHQPTSLETIDLPGFKTKSSRAPNSNSKQRSRIYCVGGLLFGIATGIAIVATIFNNSGAAKNQDLTNTQNKITPSWHKWPPDAPAPAIAPFSVEAAHNYQKSWSEYLKVPVNLTNSIGMKFCLIPPGEFEMGSSPSDLATALAEANMEATSYPELKSLVMSSLPQHKTVLTQPFYLSQHEVTQEQYIAIMEKNPSHFTPQRLKSELNVTVLSTNDFPVDSVNRADAQEFCHRLSNLQKSMRTHSFFDDIIANNEFRLPTEAEWEYACRAGTTTRYFTGDSDESLRNVAWNESTSQGRMHAVGELAPNPFGLFDIHGNAWEIVQDAGSYDAYKEFTGSTAVDPTGATSPVTDRIVRGGDFFHKPNKSRSASRMITTDDLRYGQIGFRIAITIQPASTQPAP